MAKLRFLVVLLLATFVFHVQACTSSESNQERAVFRQIPEIAEIKPKKPVKIKLKRTANGNYSWDLSGSDAEEILQADKKLKESLE